MAYNNDLYQNISTADAASYSSISTDSRSHTRRISSFAPPIPFTLHRPTADAQASLPGGKTVPAEDARVWVLFLCGTYCIRSYRHVDEMVPRWSGSLGMGDILDPGRSTEMESSRLACLLDGTSVDQRGGLEQATFTIKEVQKQQVCVPTCLRNYGRKCERFSRTAVDYRN